MDIEWLLTGRPRPAPLTAKSLVGRPPPQEGPVGLGALVGLQLADVALFILISLVNVPLEEVDRNSETRLSWGLVLPPNPPGAL